MANATQKVAMGSVAWGDNGIYRVPAAVAKTWYPGMMVGLDGSGNAVSFDDSVGGLKFDGIAAETVRIIVNSGDTTAQMALDQSRQIWTKKPWRFSMAIAAAAAGDEGKPLYAADDQTVAYTSTFLNLVGWVEQVKSATSVLVRPVWTAGAGLGQGTAGQAVPVAITASGAVAVRPSRNYVITKAGVAVLTLAAPTAVTDDGVTITITSDTANAHTLTAALDTGSANAAVATFAAFKGAGVTLMAFNARWKVLSAVGVTFT